MTWHNYYVGHIRLASNFPTSRLSGRHNYPEEFQVKKKDIKVNTLSSFGNYMSLWTEN